MWEGIVGIVVGLLIGAVVASLWLKRRAGSEENVASLKRQNAQFREEVNDHFVQTAELINQLTDSYKAVFDHLSEGAETLVEPEVVRERMPQVTDEEVRLKRLGSPKVSDNASNSDEETSSQSPVSESKPEEDADEEQSAASASAETASSDHGSDDKEEEKSSEVPDQSQEEQEESTEKPETDEEPERRRDS